VVRGGFGQGTPRGKGVGIHQPRIRVNWGGWGARTGGWGRGTKRGDSGRRRAKATKKRGPHQGDFFFFSEPIFWAFGGAGGGRGDRIARRGLDFNKKNGGRGLLGLFSPGGGTAGGVLRDTTLKHRGGGGGGGGAFEGRVGQWRGGGGGAKSGDNPGGAEKRPPGQNGGGEAPRSFGAPGPGAHSPRGRFGQVAKKPGKGRGQVFFFLLSGWGGRGRAPGGPPQPRTGDWGPGRDGGALGGGVDGGAGGGGGGGGGGQTATP